MTQQSSRIDDTNKPRAARVPAVLYLHGFASGPSSTKARYFSDRLREHGVDPLVPDLNVPSFETLTLSSQLKVIEQTLGRLDPACDLVVVGSSMGGLLATLYATRSSKARALVLLAPGFGLPRRWHALLGSEGLDRWRQEGYTEVFHYALNRTARLAYDFIVDAQQYQTDNLTVCVPTLVFHGKNDETVPVEESIRFSENNPGVVELNILEDGHELIEPLPLMWQRTHSFLHELELLPTCPGVTGYQEHKFS
ncbi:MAG TPA: YqiA/YcfP family alpha/beta fold hydrolase [Candidatus Obscuribacterales bacterium]